MSDKGKACSVSEKLTTAFASLTQRHLSTHFRNGAYHHYYSKLILQQCFGAILKLRSHSYLARDKRKNTRPENFTAYEELYMTSRPSQSSDPIH